jgi:hypothetical protein
VARASTAQRTSGATQHGGRRLAVSVVAFKDEDRTRVLCETGKQFLCNWYSTGELSDTRLHDLNEMMDREVSIDSHQVVRVCKIKGINDVLDWLKKERHQTNVQRGRVLMSAPDTEGDTLFALVELKARVGESKRESTIYSVVKLDFLVDDTSKRITGVTEMWSISEEHLRTRTADRIYQATAGLVPELIKDIEKSTVKGSRDVERLKTISKEWCGGRSAGKFRDLDALLDKDFTLWDGYGVLKALDSDKDEVVRDSCMVTCDKIKDHIQERGQKHEMKCHCAYDFAMCEDRNATFMHWMCHVTNKETQNVYDIQGMDVTIFSPDLKLKRVLTFRDPLDFEKEHLKEATVVEL